MNVFGYHVRFVLMKLVLALSFSLITDGYIRRLKENNKKREN